MYTILGGPYIRPFSLLYVKTLTWLFFVLDTAYFVGLKRQFEDSFGGVVVSNLSNYFLVTGPAAEGVRDR